MSRHTHPSFQGYFFFLFEVRERGGVSGIGFFGDYGYFRKEGGKGERREGGGGGRGQRK
jgi:hypothetical protein